MRAAGFLVLLAALGAPTGEPAPPGAAPFVPLTVEETAGLRRFGYPVTAHVPFPRGTVSDPSQIAMEPEPGGVQCDAEALWEDGSVQWARLSFNLSPGPHERHTFRLRYGPGASRSGDRGRSVVREEGDDLVVRGNYRLARAMPAFLTSVRYDREYLRAPAVWAVATVREDRVVPLVARRTARRILAGGPRSAAVEYRGELEGGQRPVPFRLEVSCPDSKSWFEAGLRLRDTERQVRSVVLSVPYRMEGMPARFDFGAGGYLYGTLSRGQLVRLESRTSGAWQALLFPPPYPGGAYAAGTRREPIEGWGHAIEAGEGGRAVAFGSPELGPISGRTSGELEVTADGTIRIVWRFPAESKAARGGLLQVRAFFHHVADPVPVTAVTSPASMLRPLRVRLPEEWRRRCGAPEEGYLPPEWRASR